MTDPRTRASELVDEGQVSAEDMLSACLSYMSWDDIQDMLESNYFIDEDEEVDEDVEAQYTVNT